MTEKKCCTCKLAFALDNFYSDKSMPDGKDPRCKACSIKRVEKSYAKYSTRRDETRNAWGKRNRERLRLREREFYRRKFSEDPGYYREKCRTRQATQLQATPPWARVGKIREQILEIYRNCPPENHVDHTIPLKHPDVCGLHVPWNLQYLYGPDNIRKSNNI